MTMAQRPLGAVARQQSALLRDVPPVMRGYVVAVCLLAAIGFVTALVLIGPAALGHTLSRPTLWLVIALVLVADVYPLMPWMRDVRGRIRIHWSAAFALAAVLVCGPPAVVLFPLIALAAASSLPSTVWRLCFNVAVLTLEGLLGVLVLHVAFGPWPEHASVPQLLAAGTVLALVWEIVNVGLVCTALVLLEGITWRESLSIGWRRTGPWLAALVTSPMVAQIALTAWIMVPGLALVTVVVHHSIASLIRKTDEARTDQLTGLANRTAALEALEHGMARSTRRGSGVTLIMVDLDGFKAVNDTYGHDAGDLVLAELGGRIRRAVDDEFMVARLGGDEFVVLGQDIGDPGAVVQTVREAIREPLPVRGTTIRLDCSTGWARVEAEQEPMDLLRAADRNLYRAKSSRRSANPTSRRDHYARVDPDHLDPARNDPAAGPVSPTGSAPAAAGGTADRSIGSDPDRVTAVNTGAVVAGAAGDVPPAVRDDAADPARSGPVRAEPMRAEPVQAEPVQAEPVQAEPVQAEPVRAEPVQAGRRQRPA